MKPHKMFRQLMAAAILCSAVSISYSGKPERCDMCACVVVKSTLRLNCSDVKFRSGEVLGPLRLPYPESYNKYQYDTIEAEFHRNRINILPRIFIDDLTTLSVAQNELSSIDPGTFMKLKYLKTLSLRKNKIQILHGKSFQGLNKLETLDLSYNSLQSFSQETFVELNSLKNLSLSRNKLTNINGKIFPVFLRTLDLSFNSIVKVELDVFENAGNLSILNLSHNNITTVDQFVFADLRNLTALDLSYNTIVKIEPVSLAKLGSLRRLLLAHNQLTEVPRDAELPSGLRVLDIAGNLLTDISPPIDQLRNLQELFLQNNKLSNVLLRIGTQLQVVNISGNQLISFSAPSCRKLRELDLSSNQLTGVPADLMGLAMPALERLSLDSNPIRELRFPAAEDGERDTSLLNLTWVSVSHLPHLQELQEYALSGLSAPCGACGGGNKGNLQEEAGGELEALTQDCVRTRNLTIRVAHNPQLSSIHKNAFQNVGICKVDLSYNALTSLDEDLLEWERLQMVDLQGNPWVCTCQLQWLLNRLVPRLYNSTPELLYELRCDAPVELRNKRLVHFYKWSHPALCSKMEKLRLEPTTERQEVGVSLGFSGPMLVAVLVLAGVGSMLILAAFFMQRQFNRKYRIRNRRM